jgi:two-component system response regulator LytT
MAKFEPYLNEKMKFRSSNPYYHLFYWALVIVVLTLVFGLSWGSNLAAFFFISMLLPIVLGTSYFFNYVLVPRYFMRRKYFRFGLYSFYMFVVSLYLETIVIMFAFIYLGNFNFRNLGPNAGDTVLLAVILYLLVFLGSLLLMARQVKEKQQLITRLIDEQEKREKAFLELISNRKTVKIPYEEILYIESLADYIQVNTDGEQVVSKEKISSLEERLPGTFLRIHRSFIINRDKIRSFTYNEVQIGETTLNIGRSYRKAIRQKLHGKNEA